MELRIISRVWLSTRCFSFFTASSRPVVPSLASAELDDCIAATSCLCHSGAAARLARRCSSVGKIGSYGFEATLTFGVRPSAAGGMAVPVITDAPEERQAFAYDYGVTIEAREGES